MERLSCAIAVYTLRLCQCLAKSEMNYYVCQEEWCVCLRACVRVRACLSQCVCVHASSSGVLSVPFSNGSLTVLLINVYFRLTIELFKRLVNVSLHARNIGRWLCAIDESVADVTVWKYIL